MGQESGHGARRFGDFLQPRSGLFLCQIVPCVENGRHVFLSIEGNGFARETELQSSNRSLLQNRLGDGRPEHLGKTQRGTLHVQLKIMTGEPELTVAHLVNIINV